VHQTPRYLGLAEYDVLKRYLLTPFLEYEKTEEETTKETDGEKVYYAEPDLSGGIEGVDYDIVYGIEDDEA